MVSFQSNIGSDHDGKQYSLSPQVKNEDRIGNSDLKSCDDKEDLEECVDDAKSSDGTNSDFLNNR